MTTAPLRRLISSVDNGVWGTEAGEGQFDVTCIRAADFDFNSLVTRSNRAPTRAIDVSVYQRLALTPGDLVLEKSGGGELSPVGRAVRYTGDGPAVTSNFAARVRPATDVDARYLTYMLASLYYSGATKRCIKQTTGIQNLDMAEWLATPVALLAAPEQRRIADFLDDRVARIDQIIAGRRQQIILLGESAKREDADVFLRQEGEWLCGPLRRFVRSQDFARIPLSSEERSTRQGRYPYYGASGIIDYVDDYLFDGPRLLLSEDGANLILRNSPIAFVADGRYWVNNHAHILQPHDDAHDYWVSCIEALDVSPWVSGSAQPKLTIDAALALPVSAPVNVRNRREYGNMFRRNQEIKQEFEAQFRRQIDLLQEYKQSLITAAVTGELDVTTASSRIPE